MTARSTGGGMTFPPTVLLVDGAERLNEDRALLERAGYRVITASEGATALRLVSAQGCDVVVSEMELPDMDSLDLCRAIKQAPLTRQLPVVFFMDEDDDVQRDRALEAGAGEVCARPFEPATLLAILRSQLRIGQLGSQIDELEGVEITLSRAVEERDQLSGGLAEKVAHWAMQLGTALALPDEQLTLLYKAALLRDVGSIGVPASVLSKHGRLDPAEFDEIKRHPVVGEDIVRPLPHADHLLPAIRHHHERMDGAGYPDGLREDIPLFARIIAIADAYVAMTNDRPYRRSRGKEEAVRMLQQGAGQQWDAALVERFLQLVKAADGEAAKMQTAG